MTHGNYKITSKVFVYPGMGGWRFLGIPPKESMKLRETYKKYARGWGSLPVVVTIRKTLWKTSLFPDAKSGTYLLPLKAQIRKIEDIADDDTIEFVISIDVQV